MPLRSLDADAPDAVFAFLDVHAAPRGRQHWRWKFGDGHAAAPSAFYWQDAADGVLGFIGMMRTTLYAGAQRHGAAWFVDWHVAPGQQGVGIGLALLRKAEAAAGILLTLQGSADTRQILPRLGWKPSLAPATWRRPLSARHLRDWWARRAPRPVRGLAGPAAAVAHAVSRCARPGAGPDGAALVDVERFPPAYDAVWQTRSAEFAPLLARDSAYLNHFCADFPQRGYRLQTAEQRGETVGHLITRVAPDARGLGRGRIVDVLWPRAQPALAAWLIASALWQLARDGADYAECLSSVPELDAALRGARFRRRVPVPLWYHRLPAGVPDPDRWHVTLLDCDRAYR